MKRKLQIQLAIVAVFICFNTAAWAGGVINSAETKTGSFTAPSYQDAWTFSGQAGDRVIITAAGTVSGVYPEIYLYPPESTPGIDPPEASAPGAGSKRLDHQLLEDGPYTIIVQDNGLNTTGGYAISLAKLPGALTSPTDGDGGAIVSAQTLTGTFNLASDTDLFQFTAAAGERVVITATGTTAGVYPEIYLYPPNGGALETSATGAGSKRLDHQLLEDGPYTIVVQDNGLNSTGGYAISLAKLPGALTSPTDTDGGAIVSAQSLTGTFNLASDTDMFQFTAAAGERVVITATGSTAGVYPEIYLYPPNGGALETSATGAGSKRLDHQLLEDGPYTIVVQDNGLNTTGGYAISLAKLPGALTSPTDNDGGAIVSAQTLTGTFDLASDTDIFQFTAAAGERVVITATGTTAGVYPEIYLYPPNGGALETSATGAGSKRLDHQLLEDGPYTIVVQDNGLNTTGTFDISFEKTPPTPICGVCNMFPYEGISTDDFIDSLSWDPVPGATDYDVYFGEDVIDPLVKVGTNISSPSLGFPDMMPLTVYYWQVVAHTPSGDIPGPIQWFKTGVLDCEGDFGNSGSVDTADLAQFASVFGRDDCGSGPPCTGDLDIDLDVDGTDVVNFIKDYGRMDCPAVEMSESFDGPPAGWTDDGSGTWSATGGVYRMIGTKPAGGAFRFSYYGSTFFDFTFQADITNVQGSLNSGGGLLFRGDGTLDNVYVFQIAPNGNYFIGKRVGGTAYTLIPSTYSSAITTGLNAVNTLRVACHGTIMQFYINDKLVNVVKDEAFDSGRVGLYAWDDPSVATEVHFDDAEVFSISIP